MLRQFISSTRSLISLSSHGNALSQMSSDIAIREIQPLTTLLTLRNFTTSHFMSQDVAPATAEDTLPPQSQQQHQQQNKQRQNNAAPPPWTPTRLLQKRKVLPKRMGHMLLLLEKEREEEAKASKQYPDFKPGDFLELTLSIPENKRRTTAFKGICIAKCNRGYRTTFTLRNFIGNSGGIERTFPLYSPHILDIKVLNIPGKKKYRRSKLYFLRNVQPKEYRV